jgi:hypothetical protein
MLSTLQGAGNSSTSSSHPTKDFSGQEDYSAKLRNPDVDEGMPRLGKVEALTLNICVTLSSLSSLCPNKVKKIICIPLQSSF